MEPVSLTLSKVTFGRSSSSLSLLICLGDRPLGSVCAARTGHRHRSQTHDTGAGSGNLKGISHSVCWKSISNSNEVISFIYCYFIHYFSENLSYKVDMYSMSTFLNYAFVGVCVQVCIYELALVQIA